MITSGYLTVSLIIIIIVISCQQRVSSPSKAHTVSGGWSSSWLVVVAHMLLVLQTFHSLFSLTVFQSRLFCLGFLANLACVTSSLHLLCCKSYSLLDY